MTEQPHDLEMHVDGEILVDGEMQVHRDERHDAEKQHDGDGPVSERRRLFRTFAYLAGRQGSTAVLGLAYWVFVTHYFGAPQVGLAFAASSTALLLSTLGILGIATFLIAEMGGMERATQRPVLSTAIVISGAAVAVLAAGTIGLSPFFGKSLAVIGSDPLMAVLFVAGSVATVAALAFDNAAIAVQRGSAQLTRGILASVLKFAVAGALILVGSRTASGLMFAYGSGIIVSLGVCYPMLRLARSSNAGHGMRARVALTRKYGGLSLNHHVLNLSINSVSYVIPVIAALIILPSQYAYFATAQTLSQVVLIIPYLLTMALFAETSNDPELLHRHVRRTLPMGALSAVAIVGAVMAGAPLALQVFGHAYSVHGTTALRTLILSGPSYVVKDHYVAIRRSQGRLLQASRVLAFATAAEAGGAALGGLLFGVIGLGTGWGLIALVVALLLSPTVIGVYRGVDSTSRRAPRVALTLVPPSTLHSDATPRSALRRLTRAVPVGDPKSLPWAPLDRRLEVVLLRIPGYPLSHGGVGAIRSLGRAGVKVHAVVEDRRTPAALSRYVAGKIVWPVEYGVEPARLVERLVALGADFATPPLLVCTDDGAAVLAAEHAEVLAPHFVFPAVPADLPRRLSNKYELARVCETHDVTSLVTRRADAPDELEDAIAAMTFPVVMKNTALWDGPAREDGPAPGVGRRTSIVASAAELRAAACTWEEPFRVVVQEYLPDDVSEDWFVHGYCDADARVRIAFTGRKLRSWPPRTGATACAYVHTNHQLMQMTASLCAEIGYRGIFDLDWRLDRRNGHYNLLDFNPRLGAQFRIFETDAGIDVLRAMHLDLSGHHIPAGCVTEGQRFVVEPFDLASRLVDRARLPVPAGYGVGRPRLAWAALDDPLPAVAMVVRQGVQSIRCRLPRRSARDATPAPVPEPIPDVPAASAAPKPARTWPPARVANGARTSKNTVEADIQRARADAAATRR